MKLRHSIQIAAVIAAFAIAGCHPSATTSPTAGEQISFTSISDTLHYELGDLSKEYDDTVYARVTYSVTFPTTVGGNDIKALQDSIAYKTFGTKGMTIPQAAKKFTENLPGIDMSEAKTVTATDIYAPDACFFSVNGYISMLNPRLMIYRSDFFTYYYHAAHGMYGSTFVNYYIPGNTVISLSDIFKTECREAVLSAIRAEASRKYGNTRMLKPDDITTFDTFYLDGGSITFVYQPYEIGPYALGMVEISIYPYMISDCLTSFGKEIFGIEGK